MLKCLLISERLTCVCGGALKTPPKSLQSISKSPQPPNIKELIALLLQDSFSANHSSYHCHNHLKSDLHDLKLTLLKRIYYWMPLHKHLRSLQSNPPLHGLQKNSPKEWTSSQESFTLIFRPSTTLAQPTFMDQHFPTSICKELCHSSSVHFIQKEGFWWTTLLYTFLIEDFSESVVFEGF